MKTKAGVFLVMEVELRREIFAELWQKLRDKRKFSKTKIKAEVVSRRGCKFFVFSCLHCDEEKEEPNGSTSMMEINAPDQMGSILTSSKNFAILSSMMFGVWFKNSMLIPNFHIDSLPISWH